MAVGDGRRQSPSPSRAAALIRLKVASRSALAGSPCLQTDCKLALRDRRIKVSSASGQIMSALSGNDRSGELTGFAKRSLFNHIAGSNLRQLLPPPDSDKL